MGRISDHCVPSSDKNPCFSAKLALAQILE
jgi:hypothetical protein